TMLGSTVQNNCEDGIDAILSNVHLLNSTAANNNGPGLMLLACSGTIDGSTLASNHGTFGDGAEIVDGNLTVTNSVFDSNDRLGMGFFSTTSSGPGAVASFAKNIVRLNKLMGVLANPGRNLRIDGTL